MVPKDQILICFKELKRVLRSGGIALFAFHIGDQTVHMDEWWDHKVSIDFNFLKVKDVEVSLRSAGFEIEESLERDPYPPEVEHQSRRAYIFARRAK